MSSCVTVSVKVNYTDCHSSDRVVCFLPSEKGQLILHLLLGESCNKPELPILSILTSLVWKL